MCLCLRFSRLLAPSLSVKSRVLMWKGGRGERGKWKNGSTRRLVDAVASVDVFDCAVGASVEGFSGAVAVHSDEESFVSREC